MLRRVPVRRVSMFGRYIKPAYPIGKFKKTLETARPDLREYYIKTLLYRHLTRLSHYKMDEFQEKWDYNKPYNEFVLAQNALILDCLKEESSTDLMIALRRQTWGLPPLDLSKPLL